MMSKKLVELQEQLEFDYDLVSVELDTYTKRLRYLSSNDINDAIQKDSFDSFVKNVKSREVVVVSFDDKTDMYEVDSIVIVLHESKNGCYIIFDVQDSKKIENLIFKQRQLL